MSDYTVVRNTGYTKSGIALRQRHNERENASYSNEDIISEESVYNVHFKRPEKSYAQDFDRLVEEGTISTRGLKPDAEVFCEFVFDVNTNFFENNGGYEYAKKFYEEAYRFAVKEVGDERYIVSAVMHADERNTEASRERGYDVFHYHLHVVYIPVVEKEIRWSKRCKDPELIGQTKEIIHQVSKSKKWASTDIPDENGKTVRIPSYSLLQDRFYEHMKEAGYPIERGRYKSTAQHLSTTEYKTEREREALDEVRKELSESREILGEYQEAKADMDQLNAMTARIKVKRHGTYEIQKEDFRAILTMAVEAAQAKIKIRSLENDLRRLRDNYQAIKETYENLFNQVKTFLMAVKIAPEKIKNYINDLIQKDREMRERADKARIEKELRLQAPEYVRKKHRGLER